jgi:hypothetical protein
LATGGVDIAATWATDERGNIGFAKAVLEDCHVCGQRFMEWHVGTRVPDYEVDLRAKTFEQGYELFGVLRLIVDTTQHYVLEGDSLAGT